MSDQLHENPERDGFRSESPIRAFATWITQGNYALGKGFRPSLQHMIPYMHAMESVENWKLLQVLESSTLTPSFLFHRDPEMSFAEIDRWLKNKGFVLAADPDGCVRLYEPLDYQRKKWALDPAELVKDAPPAVAPPVQSPEEYEAERLYPKIGEDRWLEAAEYVIRKLAKVQYADKAFRDFRKAFRPRPGVKQVSHTTLHDQIASILGGIHHKQRVPIREALWEFDALPRPTHDDSQRDYGDENPDPRMQPAITNAMLAVAIGDDPINPKHYGGTACADIGERLTANSYQVLKYNWRLGEKDDPVIELGKAIWYLDREINWPQSVHGIPGTWLPPREWFSERLEGKDRHVRGVVDLLYRWNSEGKIAALLDLRKLLLAKKAEHEVCTTGLAV